MGELATLDFDAGRKTDLASYSNSSKFLRRLMLVGFNSKYNDGERARAGDWGFAGTGDEFTSLGKKIDLLPFAVRKKVLDTNGEVPISVYNPKHPEYQRIYWEVYDIDHYVESGGELADGLPVGKNGKLKEIKDSGCMEGPSLLVYVRDLDFFELFLGNASGRSESKRIEPFLPVGPQLSKATGVPQHGPLTFSLQSRLVEKRHKWYAPQVLKCSEEIVVPDVVTAQAQFNDFINAEIDGYEEDASDGDRAQ